MNLVKHSGQILHFSLKLNYKLDPLTLRKIQFNPLNSNLFISVLLTSIFFFQCNPSIEGAI